MTARASYYSGLLDACRGQSIGWLKRCAFGLDSCTQSTKATMQNRVMRLAVRTAIREYEAEAATRVA